jgi:hypothetical protein
VLQSAAFEIEGTVLCLYVLLAVQMKIVSYSNCSELHTLEEAWNCLAKKGLSFVPSFSELRSAVEPETSKFQILVAIDNSQIIAIACFIYLDTAKKYQLGGRVLFSLPVRMVTLFGPCILGEPSEGVIQELFHTIFKNGDFDVITLGHIFVDTPIYKAASSLRGRIVWRGGRKERVWWLIRLPNSIEKYLEQMRETTRLHIIRDCKKFDRQAPEFRLLTRPEDIDIFLRDAEKISQQTYQWNLGYGIRNDHETRQHLMRLAKNGDLRCYLSYLKEKPVAFGWGELAHQRFYFRQTAFDPGYRKLSPGTALIVKIINDLIQNTDCRLFDFQHGGNDGYKSRLATIGISCADIQLASMYRPYSLLIAVLEQMLHSAKNLMALIVERGPLKGRLRAALRRSGVGTF